MTAVARCFALLALIAMSACGGRDLPVERIQVPDGFSVHVYNAAVPNARSLRLADERTVIVSTRSDGRVYALVDEDGDYRGERVHEIAEGLTSPNGIAMHEGDLYLATRRRILRYADIAENLDPPPEPEVIYEGLPEASHHGWRYLGVGPDERLYVSIGAPCNVCLEDGHAVIDRLSLDGGGRETYAAGVRNSVGFDWDPLTGDLWFTDNGRDMMGDNRPPDELNHATAAGQHFGYPFCHGADIPDPEFGDQRPCSEFRAPARALGPHVAALGMRFYTGDQFPPAYRNNIFIAEHGSWNRSEKIGYRISLVRLDDERNAVAYETFASGWLQGEQAWGRPVDVLQMPDGSLLVSDDRAGAIYRIAYEDKQ
ncbi:sorbosone dehydrogenase family protein [Ectothiorhodospiraceae bacterium WFHF3C12]|nr:sorbosone dehydrogenase family protein [Ectothiorhodospiraceae bacterium WFHF3C12]